MKSLTQCQSPKRNTAAHLLGAFLALLLGAHGPAFAAGSDEPPSVVFSSQGGASAPAAVFSSPGGEAATSAADLLQAIRRHVFEGRCDRARQALERLPSAPGHEDIADWEVSVFREACREPAPSVAPKPAPAAPATPATPATPAPPAPTARAAHRPVPRLSAVQLFILSSSAPADLEKEFGVLRAEGVDTVIVRAFHNQGDRPLIPGTAVTGPGVYFRTTACPVAADLFPVVVKAGHAAGLRVFGWITTRRTDGLASLHPEWLEYRYDSVMQRSVPSPALSVFRPEVRKTLAAMVGDLAATGVDGILFQDDLVLRSTEGFSAAAAQRFLLDTGRGVHPDDLFVFANGPGRPPNYRPLFREWSRWKSKVLMELLDELTAAARKAAPGILVAANLYPESLLAPVNGLAWLAQDAAALASRVDYLAVMSYHRQLSEELRVTSGNLYDRLAELSWQAGQVAADPARIIFKVQTIDWRTGENIPTAEWREVLDFFNRSGHFSLAVLRN